MSNKKKVSELVNKLVEGVDELVVKRVKADFKPLTVPIPSFTAPAGFKNRKFVYNRQVFTSYPDSLTDQTHALTLAQQVRRGQGDADKPDPKSFDFPDGKDDGSEAHGIFELSERVDAWLAEQNLTAELKDSFKQQVLNSQQIQAEKAAAEKAAAEKAALEKPAPEQTKQ